MSKFKFGDKVMHDEFGLCVIISCDNTRYGIAHSSPNRAQVPYLIDESELKPVSAWIACIHGQLPDVETHQEGMLKSQKIFFETSDGVIYHGEYCEDETDDYPKYFITDLCDEMILIGDVKQWMYAPV